MGSLRRNIRHGRPYTPHIILAELKKRGERINYATAVKRMDAVLHGDSPDENSLFAPPRRKSGKMRVDYSGMAGLPGDRRENLRRLTDCSIYGKTNCNEWLYGDGA